RAARAVAAPSGRCHGGPARRARAGWDVGHARRGRHARAGCRDVARARADGDGHRPRRARASRRGARGVSPDQPRHVRPTGAGRGPRPGTARDTTVPAGAFPGDPAAPGTPDETAAAAATDAPAPRKGGLGRSSALMASGTFVSRGLGLVRNVLLVAAIGTTGLVADAFAVADRIPNVLSAILARGVLNAVLVPQIVRAYRAHNTQELLDKLLTLSGVILLALSALLTAGSSILVALYTGPGWTGPQTSLAVAFAFWCTPQLFFYGLYTLLG